MADAFLFIFRGRERDKICMHGTLMLINKNKEFNSCNLSVYFFFFSLGVINI